LFIGKTSKGKAETGVCFFSHLIGARCFLTPLAVHGPSEPRSSATPVLTKCNQKDLKKLCPWTQQQHKHPNTTTYKHSVDSQLSRVMGILIPKDHRRTWWKHFRWRSLLVAQLSSLGSNDNNELNNSGYSLKPFQDRHLDH
jgi:hypothetical protein